MKNWYMYTVDYFSAIKKNEIMPFAVTQMDLEITIQSEVGQREKDKYYMISFTYGTLKNERNQLIYEAERLTDRENKLIVTKGERGKG